MAHRVPSPMYIQVSPPPGVLVFQDDLCRSFAPIENRFHTFVSVVHTIKSNQIKSNQIKSNQIKSNQIKSNQIKSNQIKSNQETAKRKREMSGWVVLVTDLACAQTSLLRRRQREKRLLKTRLCNGKYATISMTFVMSLQISLFLKYGLKQPFAKTRRVEPRSGAEQLKVFRSHKAFRKLLDDFESRQ